MTLFFPKGISFWVFPKIRVPQNGRFMMENPFQTLFLDLLYDFGVALFLETSISCGKTSKRVFQKRGLLNLGEVSHKRGPLCKDRFRCYGVDSSDIPIPNHRLDGASSHFSGQNCPKSAKR